MQPVAQISWLEAMALTLTQPAGASLYLGLVSCVLLALVAGMLLLLGRNLRTIKAELQKTPLLTQALEGQLRQAREAMGKLQQAALEAGPELEKQVATAGRVRQELQYLSARAEQLLQKMEAGSASASATLVTLEGTKTPVLPRTDKIAPVSRPSGPLAAYSQAVTEPEEAPAAQVKPVKSAPRRAADPLDELLAGLNTSPATQQTGLVVAADGVAPRVTRRARTSGSATQGGNQGNASTPAKERRAVSQAELELRASLGSGRGES